MSFSTLSLLRLETLSITTSLQSGKKNHTSATLHPGQAVFYKERRFGSRIAESVLDGITEGTSMTSERSTVRRNLR